MIVFCDGQAMTLEELAKKICENISGDDCGGCYDGSCPAAAHCRHKHEGMIYWLRKVVKA